MRAVHKRCYKAASFTSVVDPHPDGSALIWLSWTRIHIGNADPDPAPRKIIKIYKCTWFPTFKKRFTYAGTLCFMTYIKYIFSYKNSFSDGNVRSGYWSARIPIGLPPWIRIRIEVKSLIRICIETNADPQQCHFWTGWPLPHHTDVFATRLPGGLNTTLQQQLLSSQKYGFRIRDPEKTCFRYRKHWCFLFVRMDASWEARRSKLVSILPSYNLVFKSPTHNEYGGVLLLQYAKFFNSRVAYRVLCRDRPPLRWDWRLGRASADTSRPPSDPCCL